MVGAVVYDPKVVPIWEGIRAYFAQAPVGMDFVLFSNYEAQVEALLGGRIDIAWNTNLAYVRTFLATDGACRVLAMRDTDVEFFSTLVATHRRARGRPAICRGEAARARQRRLGAGGDHAGALPGARGASSPASTSSCVRFDSDVGKHGDTGRSERDVLEAVLDGRADAAAIGAASWDVFVRAGEVPPGRLAAVLDLAAVFALQLHGAAVAGRWRRRRMDRAPAGDVVGRPRAPADPRAGGPARVGRPAPGRLPRRVRRGRGAGARGSVVNARVRRRRSRPGRGPDVRDRRALVRPRARRGAGGVVDEPRPGPRAAGVVHGDRSPPGRIGARRRPDPVPHRTRRARRR